MKNPRFVNQPELQIFRRERHIGAGLPVKAEASVAVFVQLDKRERGVHVGGKFEAARADAVLFQYAFEEQAELVVSHFPEERARSAEFGNGGEHVGRCAAGVPLK